MPPTSPTLALQQASMPLVVNGRPLLYFGQTYHDGQPFSDPDNPKRVAMLIKQKRLRLADPNQPALTGPVTSTARPISKAAQTAAKPDDLNDPFADSSQNSTDQGLPDQGLPSSVKKSRKPWDKTS